MNANYLFTSERLGFRNWIKSDIPKMAAVSADKEVMRYFASTRTMQQSIEFVQKMQARFAAKRYCYFPVEKLDDGEFIGFIGLSEQHFEASFTPCVDIGWRLGKRHWGKGYATEGAKRCLEYGFQTLNLPEIVATAAKINTPSIRVMDKIGMQKVMEFEHPLLLDFEKLRTCVLYKINNPSR